MRVKLEPYTQVFPVGLHKLPPALEGYQQLHGCLMLIITKTTPVSEHHGCLMILQKETITVYVTADV